MHLPIDVVDVQHMAAGIVADQENSRSAFRLRVRPHQTAHIHRGHRLYRWIPQRLVQASLGEECGYVQRAKRRAEHHQVGVQMGEQIHRAAEQRIFEAQLDQHEHDGEENTGDRRREPSGFFTQLQPGQAERAHCRIVTETLPWISPAAAAESLSRIYTGTTRVSANVAGSVGKSWLLAMLAPTRSTVPAISEGRISLVTEAGWPLCTRPASVS